MTKILQKREDRVVKAIGKLAGELGLFQKEVRGELKEVREMATRSHHLSIKTNNALQDIKQEIILFKEENHTEHEAMKKENQRDHDELRTLILSGDKGAAELVIGEEHDREENTEALNQRVTVLEKDVRLIRQKIFNAI